MLIQTGYFYVDMNLLRKSSSNNECAIVSLDQLVVEISLEKLVVEITEQQYDAGKGSIHCANYVCARELVFDAKGKRSCNLSMWVTFSVLVHHLSDFLSPTHYLLILSISLSRY